MIFQLCQPLTLLWLSQGPSQQSKSLAQVCHQSFINCCVDNKNWFCWLYLESRCLLLRIVVTVCIIDNSSSTAVTVRSMPKYSVKCASFQLQFLVYHHLAYCHTTTTKTLKSPNVGSKVCDGALLESRGELGSYAGRGFHPGNWKAGQLHSDGMLCSSLSGGRPAWQGQGRREEAIGCGWHWQPTWTSSGTTEADGTWPTDDTQGERRAFDCAAPPPAESPEWQAVWPAGPKE